MSQHVIQEQFPPIPSADSTANVTSADVGGNKLDTVAGDSAIALAKINAAALRQWADV